MAPIWITLINEVCSKPWFEAKYLDILQQHQDREGVGLISGEGAATLPKTGIIAIRCQLFTVCHLQSNQQLFRHNFVYIFVEICTVIIQFNIVVKKSLYLHCYTFIDNIYTLLFQFALR